MAEITGGAPRGAPDTQGRAGRVRFHPEASVVVVDGHAVRLTLGEYRLFRLLWGEEGRFVRPDVIEERLGLHPGTPRVMVYNLRRKLAATSAYLISAAKTYHKHGEGYALRLIDKQ